MKKILILGASVLGLSAGAMGDNTSGLANPPVVSEQDVSVPSDPSVKQESPQYQSASPSLSTQPIDITVLDPGAEPRQLLRLSSKVGDKQRSRMRIATQPTVTIDGVPFEGLDVPPIDMTSETETFKVEHDGTIHTKFSMTDFKIDDASETPSRITGLLKSQFESLSQASMIYVFDPQGRVVKAEIQATGEDAESAKSFFEQLANSTQQSSGMFPDSPVGLGATWSAPQIVSLNGLTINQAMIYKLEDIQGDRVTLSMNIALDSEGSQTNIESLIPLPPNVKAEVTSVDMTGTGTMSLSLSQLFATVMTLDSQIKMEMVFTEADKATTIVMDMISKLQILDE